MEQRKKGFRDIAPALAMAWLGTFFVEDSGSKAENVQKQDQQVAVSHAHDVAPKPEQP